MVSQESMRTTEEIASWIDRYEASRLAFKRETTRSTYTLMMIPRYDFVAVTTA